MTCPQVAKEHWFGCLSASHCPTLWDPSSLYIVVGNLNTDRAGKNLTLESTILTA